MVKKVRCLMFIFLVFNIQLSVGQSEDTCYKRKLLNVSDQWHKIVLPLDMYTRIAHDMSDVRIYGLRSGGDTLEIPYTLRFPENKIVPKALEFNLINTSYTPDGYYFTFEGTAMESLDEIHLSFTQQNYDWKLSLKGSQDLKEWFTIVENYRILSIKNDFTDYQFGKVVFPASKYKYYRFFINAKEKPVLRDSKVSVSDNVPALLTKRLNSIKISENKKEKKTVVGIDLLTFCPIGEIKVFINKKVEFYRPFQLNVVRDSTKLASGVWNYHYETLTTGTLSSLDDNRFEFDPYWTKNIQLTINNHDNAPLMIDSIQVLGPDYVLTGRFEEQNIPYYLVYGNKNQLAPKYDITHFTIPDNIKGLDLGVEEVIKIDKVQVQSPLFENKWWLWLVMTFIILLLGWFTINMMKST